MISRNISEIVFLKEFGRQMRFIAGPRQSGKTTIAQDFLKTCGCLPLYYNWDNRAVRDRYIDDNHFYLQDIYNVNPKGRKRWLCMDEIHKYPEWKNVLKDFFDTSGNELGFIITGSAKLELFRKSGDSLAGRYFIFHLNPLMLREITGRKYTNPPECAEELIRKCLGTVNYYRKEMEELLDFSGFPEPFLNGRTKFHNKWRNDYFDRILREDMRDLTAIKEIETIAVLMKLLPDKICSPLSINSLAEDVKVSYPTVASYLNLMELVYLIFRIPAYSKKISRSITKEKKAYFYDWSRLTDLSKRFENYIAVELKSLCSLWSDSGIAQFDLYYIRTRDGRETDFLITRDSFPWLMIEVKVGRSDVAYHHLKNRELLDKIPFVQLVQENGIAEKKEEGVYQISASRFLGI